MLVRVRRLVEVEHLRDEDPPHRWAEPSVSHLRERMRWVVDNPAEAAALGARAREHMLEHYTPEAVGDVVRARLREIGEVQRRRGGGVAMDEL